MGAPHGRKELRILRRFHRDLRKEHHVARQLREPRHQLETLGAQRFELRQARLVVLPPRHREVGQRDRVEVVVGQRNESVAAAAQLHDLTDDRVDDALSWLLPVGTPHRAERAVLRAATHRLHRAPHVAPFGQQVPARGDEAARVDAAAVVDRLRRARRHIVEHLRPDDVAVALDDDVRAAEIARFLRKQRGMDAAVDDGGAARADQRPDLVAAERVTGVNADADDVAGPDRIDVERLERFVGDAGIAELSEEWRQPIRRASGE